MRHLARRSLVVFLDASIAALKSRIHDYETRGIARRPDQSFEDLYHERRALYLLYADEVVECSSMNAGRTCEAIGRIVRSRWGDSLAD
jgi:shikimate kinase